VPGGPGRRRHRGIVAAAARRSYTRLYRVLERAQPGPPQGGHAQRMKLQFKQLRFGKDEGRARQVRTGPAPSQDVRRPGASTGRRACAGARTGWRGHVSPAARPGRGRGCGRRGRSWCARCSGSWEGRRSPVAPPTGRSRTCRGERVPGSRASSGHAASSTSSRFAATSCRSKGGSGPTRTCTIFVRVRRRVPRTGEGIRPWRHLPAACARLTLRACDVFPTATPVTRRTLLPDPGP
jgi:hypothetical protein